MRSAKRTNISTGSPMRKIPKDMLDLATHIVGTKKARFEPERFEDQYEDALKDLLKKKQSGQKIEAPREREPSEGRHPHGGPAPECRDGARRRRAAEARATRREPPSTDESW